MAPVRDCLIVMTPGGVGFGDPQSRCREAVAADLDGKLISEKTARNVRASGGGGELAPPHAGVVSSASRRPSASGREKLSFSKPITRPVESFIRTTSSPASSQTYSSRRSLNHTV